MKKIALAALLAFTLLPAAGYAQVYVRVGPLLRLWGVDLRCQNADLSGLAAITDGTVHAMSGFPAAGIVRLIVTQDGCRLTGFTGAAGGSWSKDTGAKFGKKAV